jgi:hypothetical protein
MNAAGSKMSVADAATSNSMTNVLQETIHGTGNVTSAYRLREEEVMEAGARFLGLGYRELGSPGSGVFRSADGLRQFRIDHNSLVGAHISNVPDAHFEIYDTPTNRRPIVNNHVPVIP